MAELSTFETLNSTAIEQRYIDALNECLSSTIVAQAIGEQYEVSVCYSVSETYCNIEYRSRKLGAGTRNALLHYRRVCQVAIDFSTIISLTSVSRILWISMRHKITPSTQLLAHGRGTA